MAIPLLTSGLAFLKHMELKKVKDASVQVQPFGGTRPRPYVLKCWGHIVGHTEPLLDRPLLYTPRTLEGTLHVPVTMPGAYGLNVT